MKRLLLQDGLLLTAFWLAVLITPGFLLGLLAQQALLLWLRSST